MRRALAVGCVLACVASGRVLAGCAAAPTAVPREEPSPPPHVDLGPDPFRELDAGPPSPPPAPVAAEPEPPADPRVDDEAALRALARGHDCAAMHAGLGSHGHASPGVVRDLLSSAERCEERSKKVPEARETARTLLLTCGPDGVPRCRARALAVLKRLANASPRSASLAAHVKDTISADTCLAQAEQAVARNAALPPCLATAEALYRADADALMRQRALFLRGRSLAQRDPAAADRLFSQAAAACDAPRCATEKIRVLDAQAAFAAKQGHLEQVLLIRFEEDRIAAEALAPARRDYARSAKVDAACAALDGAKGPGSCRALEKKSQGHWTFHDPQAHAFAGDLPKEEAQRFNEDYLVTLQDCFRDEAGRLPVPSEVRFHLRWTINLEGRVEQVHLDPPGDDQGPLARCLRERFKIWRYPRSGGELQHVEQSFTVTARPR